MNYCAINMPQGIGKASLLDPDSLQRFGKIEKKLGELTIKQ